MAKKNTENEVTNEVTYPEFTAGQVVAHIIKDEDGFHVVDYDGTVGPVLKLESDGLTLGLTKNASCRQWFKQAKVEAEIAEKGKCDLTYKPHKTIGAIGTRMPNEKLISYLPEDLQAEYKAIIDRAIAAREADKAKPMTELEKAQAKLKRAQEALAKLEAAESGNN